MRETEHAHVREALCRNVFQALPRIGDHGHYGALSNPVDDGARFAPAHDRAKTAEPPDRVIPSTVGSRRGFAAGGVAINLDFMPVRRQSISQTRNVPLRSADGGQEILGGEKNHRRACGQSPMRGQLCQNVRSPKKAAWIAIS